MSDKNDAVAESVIRCEGLTFALASSTGREGDLREARKLLKERVVGELQKAEARGALWAEDASGVTIPRPQYEALMAAAKALARQHRPFVGRRSKDPCDVCDALAALRAAGITSDAEDASKGPEC